MGTFQVAAQGRQQEYTQNIIHGDIERKVLRHFGKAFLEGK